MVLDGSTRVTSVPASSILALTCGTGRHGHPRAALFGGAGGPRGSSTGSPALITMVTACAGAWLSSFGDSLGFKRRSGAWDAAVRRPKHWKPSGHIHICGAAGWEGIAHPCKIWLFMAFSAHGRPGAGRQSIRLAWGLKIKIIIELCHRLTAIYPWESHRAPRCDCLLLVSITPVLRTGQNFTGGKR